MIRPSKHPKLNPLGIPCFFIQTFWRVPEKIGKKRGGSNFFQMVPMLKNGKKNFLFSMMWLYPVLFSINSRLQKCNFFACTPRMNNSRLSKRAKGGNNVRESSSCEHYYFFLKSLTFVGFVLLIRVAHQICNICKLNWKLHLMFQNTLFISRFLFLN